MFTVQRNSHSLLANTYNFCYYLCLIPFRFKLESDSWTKCNKKSYYLCTHPVQKRLCALSSFLITGVSVVDLVTTMYFFYFTTLTNETSKLLWVFQLVCSVSSLHYMLVTQYSLWTKQTKYLQVVNETYSSKSSVSRGTVKCLYLSLAAFLLFVGGLSWEMLSAGFGLDITGNDAKTSIMIGFLVILQSYASVFYYALLAILIILSGTLLQLSNNLSKILRENFTKPRNIEEELQMIKSLRKTATLIRKIYEDQLLPYFFIVVSYCARLPYTVLSKDESLSEKLAMLLFFATSGAWLGFASEFHATVESVASKWIRQMTYSNNPSLGSKKTLKILQLAAELKADPVALSSKYFTVTYNFISTIIGLVASYVIILLQYLLQDSGNI